MLLRREWTPSLVKKNTSRIIASHAQLSCSQSSINYSFYFGPRHHCFLDGSRSYPFKERRARPGQCYGKNDEIRRMLATILDRSFQARVTSELFIFFGCIGDFATDLERCGALRASVT